MQKAQKLSHVLYSSENVLTMATMEKVIGLSHVGTDCARQFINSQRQEVIWPQKSKRVVREREMERCVRKSRCIWQTTQMRYK